MQNKRWSQDAIVSRTPDSGNRDFEPASSGVLQEIWVLDHEGMVQKSLGEIKYVRDNSGSLQYLTTAAKKKRQVDDDVIEAQRELNRRSTKTQ